MTMSCLPCIRSLLRDLLRALLLSIGVFVTSGIADEPARPEHPLDPAIKMAEEGLQRIDSSIKDYTAVLVKRERVGGTLQPYEYMEAKIRHQQREGKRITVPFSVYLKFIKPEELKGREVIYVKGRNGGKMIAHDPPGSWTYKVAGTVYIEPDGFLAMRGNRYPVTEIGFRTLIVRLIEVAKAERKLGRPEECTVQFFRNAKVNGRNCTRIDVEHPVKRKGYRFHIARIFIDDELRIPIRYEAYDWPKRSGGSPQLLEEYTYLKVKLNVGLTDFDFDPKNPHYKFD